MWKDHEYVEVKEHPTEEWMENQEIKEESKNTRKQMKMEAGQLRAFGMQQRRS